MDLAEAVEKVKAALHALQGAARIEAQGGDPTDRIQQGVRPLRAVVAAYSEDPICPVCGERRDRRPDSLEELLREFQVAGERVDPGGRVLKFLDGRELRVQDQCSWCDAKAIEDFLKRTGR